MPDPAEAHVPPARPAADDLERAVDVARALGEAIDGTSVSRLSVSAGDIRVEVERGEPPAAAPAAAVAPALR